jgi:crotonobetainyl-CoA:carnitine CoA-transferase CaiB-like acyl-CoA transferase
MAESAENALPLADLVVLDITIARAGPTAVRQLADWGADVIRIEPPPRPPAEDDHASGMEHLTADYLNLHRNKRSLALDLKCADGRALLHRLIPRADLLVENMRPPVKERLGFDWATVHALNPRMILASVSGFGQTGPYADRGGVDQIAQGLGGMMSVTGLPGQGPVRAGVAISDITAGLQLAVGILVALHERERTGLGRRVETSLLESMIGMLDFQAARWTVDREVPPQAGNQHPTLGPMGLFPTRDGEINIAAPWGRLWESFARVIDRADLLDDERFRDAAGRAKHREILSSILGDVLRREKTATWVERMNAVGVPAGPVNNVSETFADPQVRHLGVAAKVRHPKRGEIEVIRNATHLVGVPDAIRRPSPEAGEHSHEILSQFGLSGAEIEQLRADGVI